MSFFVYVYVVNIESDFLIINDFINLLQLKGNANHLPRLRKSNKTFQFSQQLLVTFLVHFI